MLGLVLYYQILKDQELLSWSPAPSCPGPMQPSLKQGPRPALWDTVLDTPLGTGHPAQHILLQCPSPITCAAAH